MTTTKVKNPLSILILIVLLSAGCASAGTSGGPVILSSYQSLTGAVGLAGLRTGAHAGVDFAEAYGAPVLAAAPGKVMAVTESLGCGNGVLVSHEANPTPYYTAYCHMSGTGVEMWQRVERGQAIGRVGTSGKSGGTPHVHFELCNRPCPFGHADGNLAGTVDPTEFFVGCFAEGETYSRAAGREQSRLVLTYPVRCGKKTSTPSAQKRRGLA